MKHKSERNLDLDALLEGWPASTPPPGFTERVLAACHPPATLALKARRRPSVLLYAAVAAALLILPVILFSRLSSTAQSSVSFNEPDLGIARD